MAIAAILQGTPVWVWGLFAYLIWVGSRRLKPAVRRTGTVAIVPLVFIAWGLLGLFERGGDMAAVLPRWLIGAVLGGALGAAFKVPMRVDRPRALVLMPGSVLPLLRNLFFFGAHYVLRVSAAMSPGQAAQLLGWETIVSGASAGYFIGWSVRFVMSYKQAPAFDVEVLKAERAGRVVPGA